MRRYQPLSSFLCDDLTHSISACHSRSHHPGHSAKAFLGSLICHLPGPLTNNLWSWLLVNTSLSSLDHFACPCPVPRPLSRFLAMASPHPAALSASPYTSTCSVYYDRNYSFVPWWTPDIHQEREALSGNPRCSVQVMNIWVLAGSWGELISLLMTTAKEKMNLLHKTAGLSQDRTIDRGRSDCLFTFNSFICAMYNSQESFGNSGNAFQAKKISQGFLYTGSLIKTFWKLKWKDMCGHILSW